MKVKEIRHSVELLLNLGNYSNIKLIASVAADAEPGDNVAEVDKTVREMVIQSLEEQKKALEEADADLFSAPKH
jgi:hypothetical protein